MSRLPYPLSRVAELGYRVFRHVPGRAYNVNLICVRYARDTPAAGDDLFYVCFEDADGWSIRSFRCESEPGPGYLARPMNPAGTAILVPGQYRGAYEIGQHRGRPALVQRRPVRVWRDANRDQRVDRERVVAEGVFGINIHDVEAFGDLAGCIGMSPGAMEDVLAVCALSAHDFGPRFTLTLIEEGP